MNLNYSTFANENIGFARAEITTIGAIKTPLPFQDSTSGLFAKAPLSKWLRLYSDDGFVGEVPCSTLMENFILPQILTGKTRTHAEWYEDLFWSLRESGFSTAYASEIGRWDLACHDIFAKRRGIPLHRLFNAANESVRFYASGGGVNLTDEQLAAEMQSYVDAGYDTVKMKVASDRGRDMQRDIRRVAMVRDIIGPNRALAVDANEAWSWREALDFAEKIEQYNIDWFEEPVHSLDFAGLKELTARCPFAVSMGESFENAGLFTQYIECGTKHLQPVMSNFISIADWFAVKDMVFANGLRMSGGGYSHITVALMATGDDEHCILEYLMPRRKALEPYFDVCSRIENGRIYLPDAVGTPLTLNMEKLDNEGLILKKEIFHAAV